MYVKKVRRKCDVRNCKNKDCYAISRSREVGNTIIACADCLKEALEAINKLPKETPKAKSSGIPSLFFNSKDDKQENKKITEPIVTGEVKADAGVEGELPPSSASQNTPPSKIEAVDDGTAETADAVNENVDTVNESVDETAETVDASDVAEPDAPAGVPDADAAEGAVYSDQELLEGMTVKELKAFADEIGVDVSKCKVKADLVEAIKAATAESD